MDPSFQARIEAIRFNRTSGATELAREAAKALMAVAGGPRCELEQAARAVVLAQPAMASLFTLANSILWSTDPEAACRAFIQRLDESARRMAEQTAALVPAHATVLTHSFSASVLGALRLARPALVISTESLPGGEGRALAETLRREGIASEVIHDAALHASMPRARIALVGADAVTSHAVTNKIGTALVALAARERGVALYAVAGTEKLLPEGRRALESENFEPTPLAWFNGVVTEEGALSPEAVRERIAELKVHPALGA
jgi:translation initiation factor 2B subunit (eIF-2B alpha/beta/delta family)